VRLSGALRKGYCSIRNTTELFLFLFIFFVARGGEAKRLFCLEIDLCLEGLLLQGMFCLKRIMQEGF